jgi:hypothetical protein
MLSLPVSAPLPVLAEVAPVSDVVPVVCEAVVL